MPKPRLFHLMSIAQHRLTKATDAAFRPIGISGAQLGVLFLLEKHPGAMLEEVSDGLGINASAITALIGRMEDAGLVRRRPSARTAGRCTCSPPPRAWPRSRR